MDHHPSGAAYDVVLLLHVACAVVGLVTAATAAATARRLRRLRRPGVVPEPVRRYFRPGFNWAGRTIYGIPVFGFALLGMSHGDFAVTDGWVLAGLVLFAAVAMLAEAVLWPAEQRLKAAVGAARGGPGSAAPEMREAQWSRMQADAASLERSGLAVLVLLLAATVVMVAQP